MQRISSLVKRVKAFTLIELLIVITIIGILAVALLPRVVGAPARARDEQRKGDVNAIITALEQYSSDNGTYPGTAVTAYCLGTEATIAPLLTTTGGYLQEVPADPTVSNVVNGDCTGGYWYKPMPYTTGTVNSNYVMISKLERPIATAQDGIYCTATAPAGSAFDSYTEALTTIDGYGECSSTNSIGYYIVAR